MADILPDVPFETRLTAAHAGARPTTRGVVLHSTRGPIKPLAGEAATATLEREYQAAVRYMLNPANEVSPHFCVGPNTVCRMVPDALIAWHAQEHNQTHLGIEIAQPAVVIDGHRMGFSAFEVRAAAVLCAQWCHEYGIPRVHVTNSDEGGIIGHEETDQGRRDGKSDPGERWNWPSFIAQVETEYHRLYGEVENPDVDPKAAAAIDEYLAAHPELGEGRSGVGLYYTDRAGDVVRKTTRGYAVYWRRYTGKITMPGAAPAYPDQAALLAALGRADAGIAEAKALIEGVK